MDGLLLVVTRLFVAAINLLPEAVSIRILTAIIRFVAVCSPRWRRWSHANLRLAFPEKDENWRNQVMQKSCASLARLLLDFARLPHLTLEWMDEHIDFPFLPRLLELKSESQGRGLLYATGHLGSFELLARYIARHTGNLAIVVRNFKLKKLDAWWTARREAGGNRVIGRKSAVLAMMEALRNGTDVGILFDQNVRREHAVFVDFFGRPAATTKAVALAVVRTGAPLLVGSLVYKGGGRYELLGGECPVDDVCNNSALSLDEKVFQITSRASKMYEEMIRAYPEQWFWMHRRWRTTPDGSKAGIYE